MEGAQGCPFIGTWQGPHFGLGSSGPQKYETINAHHNGTCFVVAHEHKVSLLKSKSQPITIPEASAKSVQIMAHGRGLSSYGRPVIALDPLPPTASVDPVAASRPLSCFRH